MTCPGSGQWCSSLRTSFLASRKMHCTRPAASLVNRTCPVPEHLTWGRALPGHCDGRGCWHLRQLNRAACPAFTSNAAKEGSAPAACASALLLHARQVVACASSRYEYEVFSGTVTEAASQALVGSQSALLAAARAVGAWRAPAVAAVHELVVRAPGGQSRTFRFGTATANLPAQVRSCAV